MKKKKLQLKELKVKSFVTNLEIEDMKEAKGGKVCERLDEKVIHSLSVHISREIRVHAWTISEIRNDGRPYIKNED